MKSTAAQGLRRMLRGEVPLVELGRVLAVNIAGTKSSILANVELTPSEVKVTVRLMMPYVGGGMGAVALPKPDDELLCFFPGGDRAAGIGLWGLYNGTDTVPGAGPGILLEGRGGDSARIHIRGHVNLEVDLAREVVIGSDDTTEVGGVSSLAVAADRIVSVEANSVRDVTGNAAETVGGNLAVLVGGNVEEICGGARTTVISGGGWSLVASGPISIMAGGTLTLGAGGVEVMEATGEGVAFKVPVNFEEGTTGDQT